MRKNIESGMFIEKKIHTTPELAASRFHESSPKVLSTPSLIAFMQTTCADLVAPFLDKGEMVVSIRVDMSHFASAPIGSTIDVRAEIVDIKGNTVYFKIDAFDETEKIASGHNDMFIINEERFEKGVARKSEESNKTAKSV